MDEGASATALEDAREIINHVLTSPSGVITFGHPEHKEDTKNARSIARACSSPRHPHVARPTTNRPKSAPQEGARTATRCTSSRRARRRSSKKSKKRKRADSSSEDEETTKKKNSDSSNEDEETTNKKSKKRKRDIADEALKEALKEFRDIVRRNEEKIETLQVELRKALAVQAAFEDEEWKKALFVKIKKIMEEGSIRKNQE